MAGVARVGPRVFEQVSGLHALATRSGKPLAADAARAIALLERRARLIARLGDKDVGHRRRGRLDAPARRRALDPMTDRAARPRTDGRDAAAPVADVPAAYPEA